MPSGAAASVPSSQSPSLYSLPFQERFFFFIPVKAKGLMSLPQLVPGYLCRRAAAAGAWARSTQMLGFVPVWGPYSGSGGALGDFPAGGRLL